MSTTAKFFVSAGSDGSKGLLCRSGDASIPSLATELDTKDLVDISLGGYHCAAVFRDGSVFGWGLNLNGRLGIPSSNNGDDIIKTPTKIPNLPPITKVICGFSFTLFLSEENEVFLANSANNRENLIEKLDINNKCVSISGFKYPWFSCEDGSLYKIINFDKEGVKKLEKYRLPDITISNKIKYIISLYDFSLDICLTESGEAFGRGKVTNSYDTFVEIESLLDHKIKKVSGIFDHFVVLTDEGRVFVWGKNIFGQLGLGDKEKRKECFVEIPKFSNDKIVDVSAGSYCSVFIDSGGKVWATGTGRYGRTLFGDVKERLSPERVPSIENATAVSCGWDFTYVQIGGSTENNENKSGILTREEILKEECKIC